MVELMPETRDAVYEDARRDMDICNACRYCEGFCAVFPAMERRREFAEGDLEFLANLCHNCRGCYYACQYAPPHEFGINLPRTFAELRTESYAKYAWPAPLARLFFRNGTVVSLVTALGIALVLALAMAFVAPGNLFGLHANPGGFYAVIPWAVMTLVAAITFIFSLVALAMGARNFWRATGGGSAADGRAIARAAHDVATLRNLGGGGGGCNDRSEGFSQTRRRFHHAMFYGFLLCFASTCVATFYDHFLGHPAPYPLFSLPVLLGLVGGLGMLAGTGGLAWLKITGDPEPAAPSTMGPDFALLLLLGLAAASGIVLLAFRTTEAMGTLLALHLGVILALFVLMPYSKFVHGIYRSAALLRDRLEAR
jgi:citrate/tricarballylate utilization protein